MKVFITKYALSKGIIEADLALREDGKSCYGILDGSYYPCGYYGNDFHLDYDSALKDCENRRTKKIAALKKQILQIETKSFDNKKQ